MTYGLPASGKSTWAKEFQSANPNTKRVNKDLLRAMLDNGAWSKDNEKFLLGVRDFIISQALSQGLSVICDDTNLDPKHEKSLRKLAEKHGANFQVKDFSHVPLDECIRRDQKRSDYVGEKIIRQMHSRYLRKDETPVIPRDHRLPDCYIFDLDGTLAKMNGRSPFDWDRVDQDAVNEPVAMTFRKLRDGDNDIRIMIVSGRDSVCREKTEQWLWEYDLRYNALYMRAAGDNRDDRIIKKEIYENEIKEKYNVLGIFDDRAKVVEMWRSIGLPCFQVTDGEF